MDPAYFDAKFQKKWHDDPFRHAFGQDGRVFREIKNRRTTRFELDGAVYFIKTHRGVGWREIVKNLTQLKRPVLGAANEYRAIRLLESLGLETMTPFAFAERGRNPATRESFLVTGELTGMTPLEDIALLWKKTPPASTFRHAVIRELARVCATMHRAGLNHRDCYLCHFLLCDAEASAGKARLFVLDLHRAEIRKKVPYRLQVKDVAGIFFSSMDAPLSRCDALRFIALYDRIAPRGKPFWRKVLRTAEALYRKEHGRAPEPRVTFLSNR